VSLSVKDRAKAEAWFAALETRRAVHTLTCDVVSPMAPHRDKRETPRWFEKDLIPAGTRFVVEYGGSCRDDEWHRLDTQMPIVVIEVSGSD
jgi:hypothetical protein